ncbi:MAG: PD40 domain-containing protein [Bacteroidetes bacterium]|nr:PD40 domain-containing protein [Bacteroidota bacterium]
MLGISSNAQGIYTQFGENRVIYKNIIWERINSGYDEIIYEKGQSFMAETVLQQIDFEKKSLQRELQYQLRSNIRVIIFTNFAEYSQGNFGISDQQFYAGGYIYTPQNTIFVYFNGDYNQLNKEIKKGIAKTIINEMVLGGTMLERVQSSALITLPDWFVDGLSEYYAESWSTYNDNLMRDAISQNQFKNFTSLDKDMSVFAGHSIWFFIERKYGKEKIKNILFHVRLTKSVESGIEIYIGLGISAFFKEWNSFYKERYSKDELNFNQPRGEESKLGKYAPIRHTGMNISPDGRKIAFVTNNRGAYKVWIYTISQRNTKLLFGGGSKTYTREANYLFPVVKWIEKNRVAVLQEKRGIITLTEYSTSGKKIRSTDLSEFDWVKDFDFTNNGKTLVIAAYKNGKTNLYYRAEGNKYFTQLTDNLSDISEVTFTQDGNILYISNAVRNSVEGESRFAIFNAPKGVFLYNIQTRQSTRITPVDYDINYAQPIHLGGNYISFLADIDGMLNSYLVEFNGKEIEYQDFKKLTNYNRSILFQSVSIENSKIAEMVYINGKYRTYISNFNLDDLKNTGYEPFQNRTLYRNELSKGKQPYVNEPPKPIIEIPVDSVQSPANNIDTLPKEINLNPSFQTHFPIVNYNSASNTNRNQPTNKNELSFGNEVVPLVHVDYFMLKLLDNSIIEDYYFQGGINESIFHTAMFSPHISFSLSDMFNNHTIQAGMRILGTLNGSDYYFKYKNRKGKVKKQIFFNRRARYFDKSALYQRNIMTQGGIGFEFPLSDRSRIEARLLYRNDMHIDLAVDSETLFHNDLKQNLLGTGIGYVFDNTVSRGLNMLQGTRLKIFADPYFGISKKGTNLMLGIDVRNYTKLSKQLIWANRFVANTSIGSLKTAYFIGGPENWYYSKFEGNVGNLRAPEFILQTIGAPMRGFPLNARSGTSYMVLNSELRLPIFAFLTQKPIQYEWIRSFTIVAFADLGTAWVGNSPYSSNNPYNTTIITLPDMDISVTANKNPFIIGTGFGFRMKMDSYYLKYDGAWGIMEATPVKFYNQFSLGLDF